MNATVTRPVQPATATNLCPCGKPATHLTAHEDGPDWACRVRDRHEGPSPVNSSICPACHWIGGEHEARCKQRCEPTDLTVTECPCCIPTAGRHEGDCPAHSEAKCGCDVALATKAVVEGIVRDLRVIGTDEFLSLRADVLGALRAVRAQYAAETA